MDFLAEARRRAFSFWLRTGRLPRWARPADTEVKFNPWHDPDDGRFTFRGTGRYFGRGSAGGAGGGRSLDAGMSKRRKEPFGGYGGGGRGFTGGGATGSWDAPDDIAQRTRDRPNPSQSRPERPPQASPGAHPRRRAIDNPRNWRRVEANGYVYHLDTLGRTRRVSGAITENPAQRRSRSAQMRAGGSDRRGSDEGGHYIARRFNGPTEAFNHFAQDGSFNRRSYRRLEDQWAMAIRAGKRVTVNIVPLYDGTSGRPSFIDVSFRIDGRLESLKFPNEPQGRSNAKR